MQTDVYTIFYNLRTYIHCEQALDAKNKDIYDDHEARIFKKYVELGSGRSVARYYGIPVNHVCLIIKKVKRPWIKQYHEQHDIYYDTPAWRRKRKDIIRRDHGLCQYCEEGKRRPGSTVDHTLPRRLFPEIEDDNTNLKVICDSHDGQKRKIESMCHDRHACVVKLREGGFIV